jgi:hypothetical protein
LSPVESDGTSLRGAIAGAGRARRPPRRRETLALDVLVRELVEKARRHVVVPAAVERARGRVQQRQPLLRTREPDVREAPLLLERLLLDRARVREDALLQPDHEDGAELEPLRVVERHERHERALASDRVLVE